MSRSQRRWVQDVVDAVDAIRRAEALLTGAAADDPVVDVVIDALTYRVMTIGEAVKHLEPETRALRPEIPWHRIAGMRDVIAHQYHRLDVTLIRLTVDEHLDPLRSACVALLDGPLGER